MGRRGPKPKTLEELKLVGSHHTSDRKGEIPIVSGEPEPPEWLDELGLAHWHRMVERLRNQNLLSESWRESLAIYCHAYGEFERLREQCGSQPEVLTTEKGYAYRNPLFAFRDSARDCFLKLGREFGFTPASKTGIRTEHGQAKNRKGHIKSA